MRILLLLILRKYKFHFTIISGLVLSSIIIYSHYYYSINLSNILELTLSWAFFVSIIFNVNYVFAPSVNENSNNFEIMSRWGFIALSVMLLTYCIIDILKIQS